VSSITGYPSPDEFKRMLHTGDLHDIVDRYIFRGIPYAFRDDPSKHDSLRSLLSLGLGVPESNIFVVGSGKIGFSLSPRTFPRKFSGESDLDVFVHDESLFDEIWECVLKWHYPKRNEGLNEGTDRTWAGDRKKDIYWGWLTPEKISFPWLTFPKSLAPLRDLRNTWFNAFHGLALDPSFAGLKVSGRLYRTLVHALLYQVEGLRMIKEGRIDTMREE